MEVQLKQIDKRYGQKVIFHNFSNTFASGKITGLVGDNWRWQVYPFADDCRIGFGL